MDICKGIRDNQNVQTFICMGLFEDPKNVVASVGHMIEVIHRLTYLSTPFGGTADPTIHDKVYGIVGDIMIGRQVAKVVIPAEALDASQATLIASDQVFDAATSSGGTLADTYGPFPAAGGVSATYLDLVVIRDDAVMNRKLFDGVRYK
jgi:hypothetical protein